MSTYRKPSPFYRVPFTAPGGPGHERTPATQEAADRLAAGRGACGRMPSRRHGTTGPACDGRGDVRGIETGGSRPWWHGHGGTVSRA